MPRHGKQEFTVRKCKFRAAISINALCIFDFVILTSLSLVSPIWNRGNGKAHLGGLRGWRRVGGSSVLYGFSSLVLFLSFEPEKALNLLYVYHCFLPCVLYHDNRSEKVRIHRSLERRRGSLQRTDEFFCLNFVFPRLCLDNAFDFRAQTCFCSAVIATSQKGNVPF